MAFLLASHITSLFHICTSPGSLHGIFIFIISYNLRLASLWLPEVFMIWESQREPQSTVLFTGLLGWLVSCLSWWTCHTWRTGPILSDLKHSLSCTELRPCRGTDYLCCWRLLHTCQIWLPACRQGWACTGHTHSPTASFPMRNGPRTTHMYFPTLSFSFSNPMCSFLFLKQEIVFHAYQYLYFLRPLDSYPCSQLFWKCLPTWPRSS